MQATSSIRNSEPADAQARTQAPASRGPSFSLTWVILAIWATVLYAWNLHALFRFPSYAFNDQGSNLMLEELIRSGQRPLIDFGYAYGLLSVSFSRLWFALSGISPQGFVAGLYVLSLIACYWYARFLRALGGGYARLLLLLLMLPLAIFPNAATHTHRLESVLLIAALTLHLEGKPQWALAVCSACLFVKPSMAYFYGLLLIFVLIADARAASRGRFLHFMRSLIPAAGVTAGLALALGALYDWRSLFHSLTGFTGKAIYAANGYGALKLGRPFFWAPTFTYRYYLGQPAGFWIFTSLCLFLTAAVRIWFIFRSRRAAFKDTALISIGLMQLFLVAVLWAGPWSWFYYLFLLPMFWLLALDLRRRAILLVPALLLYSTSAYVALKITWSQWKTDQSAAVTDGLYADPQTFSEWSSIRALARNSHVAVLSFGGAADMLVPEMLTAKRLLLERGLTNSKETAATVTTLREADYIVWPAGPSYENYPAWPEFEGELKQFRVVSKTPRFVLFQRTPANGHT